MHTEQIDMMLWNYCQGLFDLVPYLPRESAVQIFRSNVAAKIAKINLVFDIRPTFSVELVIVGTDSIAFEMIKVPIPSKAP